MTDCIIGSWHAILEISAHGRCDEKVISAVTQLGMQIKICQMSTLFCRVDIVAFVMILALL